MNLTMTTGEKRFLEDVANITSRSKDDWNDVFQTMVSIIITKLALGQNEVEIPYIGKVKKLGDNNFEISGVVSDLIKYSNTDRLALPEDTLLKEIKKLLLEKARK